MTDENEDIGIRGHLYRITRMIGTITSGGGEIRRVTGVTIGVEGMNRHCLRPTGTGGAEMSRQDAEIEMTRPDGEGMIVRGGTTAGDVVTKRMIRVYRPLDITLTAMGFRIIIEMKI